MTSALCAQGSGGGELAREVESVVSCPSTAGSESISISHTKECKDVRGRVR